MKNPAHKTGGMKPKVPVKIVPRGGSHMGHPGKSASIPAKFHQSKTTGKKTFPC